MALTINRHPVLIDNETQVAMDLQPGESLYAFLYRHIENLDGQQLVVSVGGREVCRSQWHALKPKDGDNIYVRFVVQKSALAIVALIALSVFTAGAAAAIAGGTATGIGGAFGGFLVSSMGTLAANAVVGAIQIVGAMLINKVLGPKPARPDAMNRDSVYSFSSTRNNVRQYEPLGLLFGVVRVTPDLLSLPYTSYRNNDQYLGMVLTPGVNVARFDPLLIGDTPLSTYEGVQVFTSGFSGMPDQVIPLYSNVDTLDGAELAATFGVPGAWVERVGPAETTRIQINLSYLLFDVTSKGKKKDNQETVVAEYRKVGDANWSLMGSYRLVSREQTEQRRSFSRDVELGQYEVRVRRLGQDTDGSGATCNMNLASVQFVQADNADYDGIPRIGLELKATGQLNGSPSQVRGVMYAETMPYWDGTAWVDATVENGGLSNPGAQILKYVRGFYNGKGELIAGMGLSDDLIDIESFKAFMVHCAENNFRYDKHLTDARSHDEIISTIALVAMGKYSWSPGRLTMLWVAEGQPHEGVATMANIKSGEFQIDYSLSQSADGIEYTYIDRATWEQKTLRVPAPGVLVMENPARLTGDGVGDEQHAATLARYHLAQNLYQFKDIVFGQDLEHLAYGELSVVMLSHDLTQWGFSGRLVAASNTVDGILIELDEDVPAASGNTPYVGLRIPGEGNYRVFQVERVASNMLKLIGTWPAGVPFPGVGQNNPAHDTIWLYDFKQTPGLRCRVIGISPADNLNGASISVVPESDEFWNYVKTGEYIPPANESQLQTQPQVRNLLVQEEVVNQGNTVFSMIHASWLVEGVADRFTISVAGEDGVYRQLSETDALAYQWRMDTTGQITVLVRPIDENGVPGVAQSFQLTVYGADRPPILASEFDVIQLGAGVRKYTWSFADQSPDLAGVEIRMVSGVNLSPVWEDMTPVGDTGFFTAPFEATIPAAGSWTFALRSINTNGVLSDEMRVIARTLSNNLSQVISETNAALVAEQQRLDQEVADRLAGDLAESQARAAAITATTTQLQGEIIAARDAAIAHADVIGAQVADILEADEWVSTTTYPAGDLVKYQNKLYRALRENTNKNPVTSTADWEFMGNYTSLGEAVAASISIGYQNTSDIAAEAQRIDGIVARMPSGTDMLANEARVVSAEQASVTRDQANARATQLVSAELAYAKVDAGAKTFRQQTQPAITGVRNNLFAYSTFGNGNANIELVNSGLPDPFFGNKARLYRIKEGALTTGSLSIAPLVGVSSAAAGTYTAQVWVKAGTAYKLQLGIYSNGNPAEPGWGVLSNVSAELDGPGTVAYTNGLISVSGLSETEFTKITLRRTLASSANIIVYVYINTAVASQQVPGKSLIVFGPQLEAGSAATAYQHSNGLNDFDGSGLPVGSVWEKTNTSNVVIDRLRYNGTAWESVVDTSRASAIALNDLSTSVGLIDGRVTSQADQISALTTRVGDTEAAITQEAQARSDADAALAQRATLVEARMPSGTGLLSTAQATADAAAAAQAASDLAGGKGKVIYGSTAPAAADRLTQNLWIDTTGGANTPKRWNGTVWAAVTDKAATDAAAAASAAQQTANTAVSNAATAQAAAQAASDLAGGKGKVIYGSTAPAAADRLSQNLWIDTAGGANTPKRWNGSAWVAVTDKVATDAAAAAAAAAQAAATVDARVTTVENASVSRDNALGSRVELVEARMPVGDGVLATATALQALGTEVDANGQAIGTLTGQVAAANQAANQAVTATEELRASVGGGGNLLSNSFFAADTAGWSVGWGQTIVNWVRNWSGVNMPGAGVMLGVGTPVQGEVGQSYFSSPVSVDVRNKYIGSAYVASSGNFRAYVFLIFYDAVGNELPSTSSPQGAVVFTDGGQWSDISLYERLSTPAVNPPAGAATCRIMIRAIGLGGGVSAVGFTKAMVEQASPGQTQPSPWSAGGLETAASHTVSLDVNGHVSGTQSINDGKRSSFSILASVFRVISNIVNAGMEWQDGYLRMWKGGAQLVMGHTFGSGDLIFWYGPNIGSAACTKGNGTIWFDTAGGAYFGGTLSAGVRKNAAQSTQVSGVASVETGQFGTVGNPKVVTASLSYYNYFTTASNLGTSNTPLSATLILERSYAGGGWTQVQSAPVNGTRVFDGFEGGVGYSYGFSLGGSFNFTDNLGGTGNFNYRVRVANASGWPVTKPEGGANAAGSQTTSVVSVEQ